jgi:sec-independent protein translocase protein TatA
MIGTTEIVIIVAVVLVLFGATAIPKFARSLGRAKKEFEKGIKEGQVDEEDKKTKELEDNQEQS